MSEVKIMQSEIDKMIQEEVEDYAFLNEVRKPEKEASMRIAKTRVKEIIQEELDRYAKLEHDEKFFSSPEKVEESPHGWSSEFADVEADVEADAAEQVGNKNAELVWSMFMRGLDDEAKRDLEEEIGFISSSFDGIADPDRAIMAMNTIENHKAVKLKPAMRGIFRVIRQGLNSMNEGLLDKLKTGVGK